MPLLEEAEHPTAFRFPTRHPIATPDRIATGTGPCRTQAIGAGGRDARSSPPPDPLRDELLVNLLIQVGDQLITYEQYAEGEAYFREAHALQEKSAEAGWYVFVTKTLIGRALMQQQKFPEAESQLLAGFQGLEQFELPAAAAHRETARKWIMELYVRWNQPAKAEEWKLKGN